MKTTLKFIALGFSGLAFVSCCGFDNNYSTGKKTVDVITYENKVVTVNPGGKGEMPYTKVVKVPVVTKQKRVKCVTTDKFKPHPDCGGKLSDAVVKRASVQGASGEPFIGLIPTMKPLVAEVE